MKLKYPTSRIGLGWKSGIQRNELVRTQSDEGFVMSVIVAFLIVMLVSQALAIVDKRLTANEHILGIPAAHGATLEALTVSITAQPEHKVVAGTQFPITATYKNISKATWTYSGPTRATLKASEYLTDRSKLPAQYWYAGETVSRIQGTEIKAGATGNFSFSIQIPKVPGTYYRTFTIVRGGSYALPESEFTVKFVVYATSADLVASMVKPGTVTVSTPSSIPVSISAPVSVIPVAPAVSSPTIPAKPTFEEYQYMAANRPLSEREKVAAKYNSIEALQEVLRQCSALRVATTIPATQHSLLDDCMLLGAWSTNPQNPITTPNAVEPAGQPQQTPESGTVTADPIAGVFGADGPLIRVGLYNSETTFSVRANTEYVVKDSIGTTLATVSAGHVTLVWYNPATGQYVYVANGIEKTTPSYIRLEPTGPTTVFEIMNYENRPSWNTALNDNRYGGALEIRYNATRNRTWMINEIALEEYLKGLAETTNSTPIEYQKAQVIAARSYAMHHYLTGTKHAKEFFTIDAYYDQVYKGYNSAQRMTQIRDAVEVTRGIMVTHDNKVAVTPYFAHSNGRTRSWAEVWGQNVPWAQSVSEPAGYDKDTYFGHGVGMSQRGGILLASTHKYTFDKILQYYYTGITLKKIY